MMNESDLKCVSCGAYCGEGSHICSNCKKNALINIELYQELTITDLVELAHNNAVQHGFWEDAPEFGTSIALIHSELSEALEEVRAGRNDLWYNLSSDKPEGYGIELADAVIRIADLCGSMGIDLERMIKIKMGYNATRPYKHGKEF